MNFHVESYYDNTIPTIQDTYSNRALIVPYNCSPLYLLSSLQVLGLQLSVFRDSETDQLWIIINKEVITIEMGFLETKRRAYTISVLWPTWTRHHLHPTQLYSASASGCDPKACIQQWYPSPALASGVHIVDVGWSWRDKTPPIIQPWHKSCS